MGGFVLDMMWKALNQGANKLKELKFAFGIPAVAAGVAIAAEFTQNELNTQKVIVAVSMGVMLILAFLMIRAIVNAKDEAAKPYARLYLSLAWVFAGLLASCAVLSATSLFFKVPLDFDEGSAKGGLAPEGDYHIDSTVVMTDLRKRIATNGEKGPQSRDIKIRTDFVIKRRETQAPYEIQTGTNGLPMEEIGSETHPGMTTEEVKGSRFGSSTKYTFLSSIPADQIFLNHPTKVQWKGTYINAFSNNDEEWTGTCPNIDTDSLTMVVLFPENKPAKAVRGMEEKNGSPEKPFTGASAPLILDGGRIVTWTITKPTRGIGYYIVFNW